MTEPERFHSLDALRASALLLGIVLHATMSFLPGFRETGWPISDVSESYPLAIFFFVVHIFRMLVFFLVAGFFARLLFERLGLSGFIKNRLRRIALPLVAFFPIVVPLCVLAIIWGAKQLGITGPPAGGAPSGPGQAGFPWFHFWFLYLLLQLYALALMLRAAVVAGDRQGRLRAFVDRVLQAVVSTRAGPLLMAAPLAVALYYTPWWLQWPGIPSPLNGFIPSAQSVLAFGSAVAFGWLLHRQRSLLELLRRDYVLYLVAAVGASLIAIWLIGIRPNFGMSALSSGTRAAYAIAYTTAAWAWCFGLIGAAMAWMSAPSARWRYLADASYWMYLIHVPIVWGLQAWMLRWPLHWAIKFPLILAITAVLLLASYHYLVRATFMGKFLNGRKYERALPRVSAAPSISPG
jgi:glucans biosynthesis protein C